MSATPLSPAVSVVIPAYLAAPDIRDALDSVFAQTFSSFEVVVVNDGSPDTPEFERAIEPYRSHIVYIKQPNQGAAGARNTGVRAARGRFVAFLDADDLWAPEFLRRQAWYLDAWPACTLVYADALITGDSPLAGRRFMDNAPSEGDVTLVSLIEQRCNVLMSTVVARRPAMVDAGLFDKSLRRGQDFDLWLRLAAGGHAIGYQRMVLAERRARATGLSGDTITELERAINVLDRFGRQHDLPYEAQTALRVRLVKLMNRLEVEQGKLRLVEGNFAAARYHMAVSEPKTLRLRAALLGLHVAPRLLRQVYLAVRPQTPTRPAMIR
jgi:glycosyltransferase involved in cell wall biosynthesis